MSASNVEKILRSPFPRIAAEVQWQAEQRYGSKEGLQLRLKEMTKAGIMSEVLDVIEALQPPPEKATQALIITYENAATSAERSATWRRKERKFELAEGNERAAQGYRAHASALREGTTTVAQEVQARVKEREALGVPDNYYINLLTKPVFPK